MLNPPSLREMLDALATAEVTLGGNALGVYLELVDEPTFTPEKALYAGLTEMGIIKDINLELAEIADEPIRLRDDNDRIHDLVNEESPDDNPDTPPAS